MPASIDLSIIIVNWNTSQLLLQCLDSIFRAGSRHWLEVIVVDNGSTDDSLPVLSAKYPDVRLVANHRNMGFARANNQGMSLAQGRYYLLLNSDTIVLPGALDKLISAADEHPQVGVIGPELLNSDESVQESWASFPSFASELLGRNFRERMPAAELAYAYEVDWIMGACMLVRSDTAKDVGLLDEDYFMYSEETDWCFRIRAKGWKVWYLVSAKIYHLGGGSADRSSLTQLFLLYSGKILFFRKHYGVLQAILLRYGLALANSVGVVRRAVFRSGGDPKVRQRRLLAQSKLVWYLIRGYQPG